MSTDYTPSELKALLDAMDYLAPPVPTARDKAKAGWVAAMRAVGTQRGILFIIETKQRGQAELFWFNCWVAKETAAAINFVSQNYGWPKRCFKPTWSEHLETPEIGNMKKAAEVLSISSRGVPGGILIQFAIGRPPKDTAMFFPANAALEIRNYIVRAGSDASWWGEDFELTPTRVSTSAGTDW
jgi:hypothetical protein